MLSPQSQSTTVQTDLTLSLHRYLCHFELPVAWGHPAEPPNWPFAEWQAGKVNIRCLCSPSWACTPARSWHPTCRLDFWGPGLQAMCTAPVRSWTDSAVCENCYVPTYLLRLLAQSSRQLASVCQCAAPSKARVHLEVFS